MAGLVEVAEGCGDAVGCWQDVVAGTGVVVVDPSPLLLLLLPVLPPLPPLPPV